MFQSSTTCKTQSDNTNFRQCANCLLQKQLRLKTIGSGISPTSSACFGRCSLLQVAPWPSPEPASKDQSSYLATLWNSSTLLLQCSTNAGLKSHHAEESHITRREVTSFCDNPNGTAAPNRKPKSNQNTVGTQANDQSTKNANESAKATKVLRTTAKMIHELPPDMKQNIKILWAHKLMTKAQRMQMKVQKQRKYCAQQQKWYMNYHRIWNKTSKYCGHTS